MIDIESIFRYKKLNEAKLLKYNFEEDGLVYRKEIPIKPKSFRMDVVVSRSGAVEFKVIDTELDEEYALVNVSDAEGAFVGAIREECERALANVAEKCFDTEILKAEQTKRVLHFIEERYGAKPEFLWESYPGYAAFRRADNAKWFAIIMTVDRSKLGLPGHGNIEIIDLKAEPELVEERLKQADFYPAYHMNKKHWFTVCLDGSLKDEELFTLLDASYNGAYTGRKA